MSKERDNTFAALARLGISNADAAALVRASATLHTWHEHECNGTIQREELVRCSDCKAPFKNPMTHSGCCDRVVKGKACRGIAERYPGAPYWYSADSGQKIGRTSDRETGAIKRIETVLKRYPALKHYVQGDPRGCALYILRPGDVPEGCDAGSYYSRGIAVVP